MDTQTLTRDNPGFLELLKRAAIEEQTLVFEGPDALKRAQTCRFRIYAFRKKLMKADHPLGSIISRVELRLRNHKTSEKVHLIASPGGDDFTKELRAAGIDVEDAAPSLDDI